MITFAFKAPVAATPYTTFSTQAFADLCAHGVHPDEAAERLRKASEVRSQRGNRRHRDLLFSVESRGTGPFVHRVFKLESATAPLYDQPDNPLRSVSSVASAKAPPLRVLPPPLASTLAPVRPLTTGQPALAPGEFLMWEEHDACGGKGCGSCVNGEISVVRRESTRVTT